MAAAGCDGGGFSPGAELRTAYGAQYRSQDETSLRFEDDPDTSGGPTAWFTIPGFVPAYEGRDALSEGLGYGLDDCSDERYRCVKIGLHAILAVPREQFSPHHAFDVAGAKLEVVACSDASCSSALIRTGCAFWEMTDDEGMSYRCVSENLGNAEEGRPWYFLFDRARGVVLIGDEIVCQPSLKASECFGEHAFELQTPTGLLAQQSP